MVCGPAFTLMAKAPVCSVQCGLWWCPCVHSCPRWRPLWLAGRDQGAAVPQFLVPSQFLSGMARQEKNKTKQQQTTSSPLSWAWNAQERAEMSSGRWHTAMYIFKAKIVQNSKIEKVFILKSQQTHEHTKLPALSQANLAADQGSKYIKIFYPIICFDQLTTILKIQSWSSWQVQLPNFIEEFFFSFFHFSILLTLLLMPRQ